MTKVAGADPNSIDSDGQSMYSTYTQTNITPYGDPRAITWTHPPGAGTTSFSVSVPLPVQDSSNLDAEQKMRDELIGLRADIASTQNDIRAEMAQFEKRIDAKLQHLIDMITYAPGIGSEFSAANDRANKGRDAYAELAGVTSPASRDMSRSLPHSERGLSTPHTSTDSVGRTASEYTQEALLVDAPDLGGSTPKSKDNKDDNDQD